MEKALFSFRPLTGKKKSFSLRPLWLCGEGILLSASLNGFLRVLGVIGIKSFILTIRGQFDQFGSRAEICQD
jgi:hypothetical protein